MRHSYSSWSTYKQCPAKFKFSYIDKLPRGAVHPNAKRGTEIHKSVEDFINGSQPMLHPEINSEYGHWITSLKNNSECLPEPMWLVNSNWELIDNAIDKIRYNKDNSKRIIFGTLKPECDKSLK